MSLLYPGRIDKLEIGVSAAVNTDITNVVLMNWERNHDVRPRLYANRKYPTTFQQPHSWVLGSFSCLSDNHTAVYATDVDGTTPGNQYALIPDSDSNVIDFFQVIYQDEDGNQRVTRFFHALIYRFNKELLNYDDSAWIYHFIAGYAVDDVVTPLELNLISIDGANPNPVYIHDRISCVVLSSCTIVTGAVAKGLTLDPDGNLCTVGQTDGSLFIMDGVSCTITTSCSTPGDFPWGLTLDNSGNLISTDTVLESIYIHNGVSCTITTSCSSPGTEPTGLTVDEDGNLISADSDTDSIYIHSGITCVITTSFSSPGTGPTGLTLDENGNLVSADANSDSFYIHDGVTSTITTSCSSPGAGPQGLTTVET